MNKYKLYIIKIEKWATVFFLCASVFIVILLTQALILTWFGQFKLLFLNISLIISFLSAGVFYIFIIKDLNFLPRFNIYALAIICIVCIIFSFFPHDTFGGRDEGLYSNLAVYLTNHGNLLTPWYLYANPADTGPWTGRVPAYTAWLAIQNIYFGQNWMLMSSMVLITFGLFYLYMIANLLSGKKVGLITIILFTTCFQFLWLGRETLSENLAFFLLWASITFLFFFIRTKNITFFIGLLLINWLFSFARVEGLYIQIATLLVLLLNLFIFKKISLIKTLSISLLYILFIGSTFLIYSNISNTNYNKAIVSSASLGVTNSVSSLTSQQNSDATLSERFPFFIMLMFAKYNLLLVLLSPFIILPLIMFDKKMNLKSKIGFIGITIIILPEFAKFIFPGISLDQPWFFRRYIYAIIPFGFLYFSILLNKITNRRLSIIIIYILLIVNIVFSIRIITLKNNWSVTSGLEEITNFVSPQDLIMIKNYETLNNYLPETYLTYQKEIRTFYSEWMEVKDNNWLPAENKFQGKHYDKLFLLSNKENDSYNNFKLRKISIMPIETKQLQWTCVLPLLKEQLGLNIDDYSNVPFQDAVKYCSNSDNEIFGIKKNIYLYELLF